MSLPRRILTIVEWNDAWQDQENFTTAHGIRATHEPMKVFTEGHLIQDDDTGISIANEQSSQDGQNVYRGRTMIPRAMVKNVEHYHLVKIKKKKADTPIVPASDPNPAA